MKPAPLDYHRPASLEEVLDLLGRYGDEAKLLAGGQSLVPLLNLRLSRPAALVDLNRVPGLDGILEKDGGLRLGALVRQQAVERSPLLRARAPLLVAATAHVAHHAIRSRGTVGGSVAHADPAAEYPAVLAALDGEVVARSRRGERVLPARELFRGPLTTSLRPDEVLVEVRLPLAPPGARVAFEELSRRHGDFAVVGVAAMAVLRDERCALVRLAACGVGPVPLRLRAAEAILEGDRPSDAAVRAAARRGAELVDPDSDIHASAAYRRHLAEVLVARALCRALGRRAPGSTVEGG